MNHQQGFRLPPQCFKTIGAEPVKIRLFSLIFSTIMQDFGQMRRTDQPVHILLQFKKRFEHLGFINLHPFPVLKDGKLTKREILRCQTQMAARAAGVLRIGFDQTVVRTENTDQPVGLADVNCPQDKSLESEMCHVIQPQF